VQAPDVTAGVEPRLEVTEVADSKGLGTGDGNGWGPHASRIVRASNGDVYIVVMGEGRDYYHRTWRVMKRSASDGKWSQVETKGTSAADVYNPPSILIGPDDELYVVAWPNMKPHLWSSATEKETAVSGQWYLNKYAGTRTQESSYGSASIDSKGTIYLSQSSIGCNLCDHENKPGFLYVATKGEKDDDWRFNRFETEYRYTYSYLLPGGGKAFSLVASLDVRYAELGYKTPPNTNVQYAFNGVAMWQIGDAAKTPDGPVTVRQPETQSSSCLTLRTFASDVYQDTKGRIHVIYDLQGPSTNCAYTGRHAVIDDGKVVKDVSLSTGGRNQGVPFSNYARISQDSKGRFYILTVATPPGGGTSCMIYLQKGTDGDTDGTDLQPQQQIPLSQTENCSNTQNHFIAAPRGGTELSDRLDGFVATDYAAHSFYYRLCLRDCS
jgi:hypothetical protein